MTFYRLFIQKDVTNLINHVFCSQILNYETCVDADQGVRIGTGPSRQHRKDKRISVQEHTMTDNASDLPVSGNELNSKINLNFERILSQALRLALRDATRVRAGNEPLMRIESEHSLLVLKSTCPRIEIELL